MESKIIVCDFLLYNYSGASEKTKKIAREKGGLAEMIGDKNSRTFYS